MLKLTFLGTSGSAPTVMRSMPAIALQYDGDLLLWDAGEGTQRQMMKFGIGYGSVNAVFVSHPHIDHYLGLFGLLETLNLARTKKQVDVFGFEDFSWLGERYGFSKFHKMAKGELHKGRDYAISAFPVKHCKGAYGFVFQENDMVKFHEKKAHALGLQGKMFSEIQKKGWVEAKGKKVKLEDVTWKRKGRKIVYSGDTMPCATLAKEAEGADVLIHDATFDPEKKEDAKERLHSTMEDAALLAKKAKVGVLLLTHFSPRYADAKIYEASIKKIFSNTIFAYDGLVLDVNYR